MKYTCLVVYNHNDILESGQFSPSNLDDFLKAMQALFSCQFLREHGMIYLQHPNIEYDVEVGDDRFFNKDSMTNIFDVCVSEILGETTQDKTKIFISEGNQNFTTTNFAVSHEFFEK